MKPGNPLDLLQEGCQFRRIFPQDEGNEQLSHAPEIEGFFCALKFVLSASPAPDGYCAIIMCFITNVFLKMEARFL
jgi:hypothetical protein